MRRKYFILFAVVLFLLSMAFFAETADRFIHVAVQDVSEPPTLKVDEATFMTTGNIQYVTNNSDQPFNRMGILVLDSWPDPTLPPPGLSDFVIDDVGYTLLPEPSTMMMFGACLIGLAGIMRMNLKKKSKR